MATKSKNWRFLIGLKSAEQINKATFKDILNTVEWMDPVTVAEDSPYGVVAHSSSIWPDFADIKPVIWKLQDAFPNMTALDMIFHRENKLRTMGGTGRKAMYCADLRIESFEAADSPAEHMDQVQRIISTYTGRLEWTTMTLKGRNWSCYKGAAK